MSTRFYQATNLSLEILNDVLNPVVVGHDRSIAHNGGGVSIVNDAACLRGRRLFVGHKV